MNKFVLLIVVVAAFAAFVAGGIALQGKNDSKIFDKFAANLSAAEEKPEEASLTDEELKEKIGQMIMIGFRGTEADENSEIYKIIKDIKIGGVALFDYDVPSNSFPRNIINPEQTKKLISDLQKYSVIPMFAAVDAEGGNVNRLKQKYGFLPVVSAEKMGQDKTLKIVASESEKLAKELKNAGFNMNFAPVVDVNLNPKSPIIGALGRSFSSNAEEVANQAEYFIKNHIKNNIIPVGKHFPGQGSSVQDTHIQATDMTNTYKEEELVPYQKLNDSGLLDAVMTAHVINKKIDDKYPASLSAKFLQDILRNQIGFKGVIISDDMQMAAIINNYKLDEAVIMAVNAGCDVISVLNNSPGGYDKDMAYKVRDIIFNAVKEKKIEEKRIIESYDRIINLKKKFQIIKPKEDAKEKIFELVGDASGIVFGKALDMAKYVEGLTGVRPAFLLAVFQQELNLQKEELCYVTNLDTGEGVKILDGKKVEKVLKPDRDAKDFLTIMEELKREPSKTPLTCPMSFGWGGAMGPADFIPSTWMKYKDKIEKITGSSADPWNIEDAFLGAGLYLSDSGAKFQTRQKEWEAAMVYFSGSAESGFNFYADGVLTIADKLQTDIDMIEKK